MAFKRVEAEIKVGNSTQLAELRWNVAQELVVCKVKSSEKGEISYEW